MRAGYPRGVEAHVRIGIFDSGIGGLTVLRALREAMPEPDLVYLGDTARIPYGTRTPITVVRYSLAVASFLHDTGVDALVVACNTASTHALPALQAAGRTLGIPVFGVIEPGVQAALGAHGHGAIAVLGTEGTVETDRKQIAMHHGNPEGFICLSRQRATALVSNRTGNHQRNIETFLLFQLVDGVECRLAVESVEDCLDHQNV